MLVRRYYPFQSIGTIGQDQCLSSFSSDAKRMHPKSMRVDAPWETLELLLLLRYAEYHEIRCHRGLLLRELRTTDCLRSRHVHSLQSVRR